MPWMRSDSGSYDIAHCTSPLERFAWLCQFGLLEPVSWRARQTIRSKSLDERIDGEPRLSQSALDLVLNGTTPHPSSFPQYGMRATAQLVFRTDPGRLLLIVALARLTNPT